MITIDVDNLKIEKKYSDYEIKMKFIKFLEQDMKYDVIDLYEIGCNRFVGNIRIKFIG